MSQTDVFFYARRKTEPQAELQAEEVLPFLLVNSRNAAISVPFINTDLFILCIYEREIRGNNSDIL